MIYSKPRLGGWRGATAARCTAFALLVVLVCVACSRGSGGSVPTVITGNVRSASTGSASSRPSFPWLAALRQWISEAEAQVPGVNVAIENSSVSSSTDETGTFRLEGNQFGPATLRFTGSGADGTLAVTLPASGFLRLVNVQLSGSKVTFEEQRIELQGPLTGSDCGDNLLQALAGELVAFRVRIQPGTVIEDRSGTTLHCTDLVTGQDVKVQGTVDATGTVLATLIMANPPPQTGATPVTFEGSVDSLDCPSEITVDRGADGTTRVEISSSTEIRDAAGHSINCSDLGAGDSVHVDGNAEGSDVAASRIDQGAVPTPTPGP